MAFSIKIEGYDSFEQIALGGMAAVYKARKVSVDKIVAIKVLFPYLANDESFIERFQREAKSAAKVQHENIVNVIDFGESGGCYYIVMEYYEGLTVAELIEQRSRVPLDIAVNILLDVCLGLEAAHDKGIIHRDIKPGNVIFTHQGGVKIADFGLAKKSDTMTVVTQPGKDMSAYTTLMRKWQIVAPYQVDWWGTSLQRIDKVHEFATQDEINLILGGNAARLFKLPVAHERMFMQGRPDVWGINWEQMR